MAAGATAARRLIAAGVRRGAQAHDGAAEHANAEHVEPAVPAKVNAWFARSLRAIAPSRHGPCCIRCAVFA